MTDPIENPEEGAPAPDAAPAAPEAKPAPPAIDVDTLRTQLRSELEESFNKRVADFQRMISERDEQIKELRLSGLPDDEREAAQIEEAEAYYASVEQENWLLKKARDNADAASFLEKLYKASDSDEQFAAAVEFLNSVKPASPATPEAEPDVPDVDPNNPAPQAQGVVGRLPDGTPFTNESVESFLKALGNESVAKIRGPQ